MPHQSPGLKHSLTRTSPRLRRTRTPSCAPRSSGSSTCSWPPAPLVGVGARHGEEPDAEGADHPRSPSSASACPRLRAVRARVQLTSLMCARTARSLARLRLTHTGSQARPSGPGSPCSCYQGGHVCITDDSPWFQSNPPPSHHAVKATRVRVHSKVVLSPPDLTPRPDARRYRRKTVVRQGGQPGLDAEAPTDPLAVEDVRIY